MSLNKFDKFIFIREILLRGFMFKKVLITPFCFLFFVFTFNYSSSLVFARDITPIYSDSVKNFGIGLYFMPEEVKVFSEPVDNSKILKILKLTKSGDLSVISDRNKSAVTTNTVKTFLTFLEDQKKAGLIVTLIQAISRLNTFQSINS